MWTHLDLFSGIGGFAYAAQQVWGEEYKCIGFVEINRYCQELLKLRFPGVKIYEDIRTITADTYRSGRVYGKPKKQSADRRVETFGEPFTGIEPSLLSTKDTECFRRTHGRYEEEKSEVREQRKPCSRNGDRVCNEQIIDLLTGGFPCQPFSQAGKRKGTDDNRYLWPQMLRVIKEFKPRWVVAENVYGILNIEGGMVFEQVCTDLEDAGYTVQPFIIPACAVNAPHRRDRVWIIANSRCEYGERAENGRKLKKAVFGEEAASVFERPISNDGERIVTNTNSKRGRTQRHTTHEERQAIDKRQNGQSQYRISRHGFWEKNWLEVATELCGVDDGLPAGLDGFELSKAKHRVERLKALGNAIVPQVAMQIFEAIKAVDVL